MTNTIKNYWPLVLCLVPAYFSAYPAFLLAQAGLYPKESLPFFLTTTICALIAMIVIPALFIKFYYKKNLKDFGFCFPIKTEEAVKATVKVLAIFLVIIFLLSTNPVFQKYYLIKHGINGWFFVEIIISFFYFISEEFFFRGFLLFGLWDKFKYRSFWIISLIFALFHIGKPSLEILFAFFAGFILSQLSYKTRSIFPATIVHFIIALALNLIILIR